MIRLVVFGPGEDRFAKWLARRQTAVGLHRERHHDRRRYDVEVSGLFDESTKSAVTALYNDAGYDPVPTSLSYPADLAAAERAVTDAEASAETAQSDLAAAGVGPAGSEIAAADAAVAAAERMLEDALATRVETVDVAKIAVAVAKAGRDETHATPGVSVDQYNAANVTVHNAEVALTDAILDNDANVEASEDLDSTPRTATRPAAAATDWLAARRHQRHPRGLVPRSGCVHNGEVACKRNTFRRGAPTPIPNPAGVLDTRHGIGT